MSESIEKHPHFIELENVKKTYGGPDMEPVHALKGINLIIDDDLIVIALQLLSEKNYP